MIPAHSSCRGRPSCAGCGSALVRDTSWAPLGGASGTTRAEPSGHHETESSSRSFAFLAILLPLEAVGAHQVLCRGCSFSLLEEKMRRPREHSPFSSRSRP